MDSLFKFVQKTSFIRLFNLCNKSKTLTECFLRSISHALPQELFAKLLELEFRPARTRGTSTLSEIFLKNVSTIKFNHKTQFLHTPKFLVTKITGNKKQL